MISISYHGRAVRERKGLELNGWVMLAVVVAVLAGGG
jgi:hypothetical protein